jgi:hypothetical protein
MAHVLRQPGVDHEHDRHAPRLAGRERLLREAEALDLLEILAGGLRAVARHRLPRHRRLAHVDDLVLDHRELAGMHLDRADQRLEAPRQVVRVRVELDGHRPRGVDLGADLFGRPVEVVDAQGGADLVVERHQREREAEHADRHDRQAARQAAVLGAQAHRRSQYLAMIPRKNARAIEARTMAVFAFRLTPSFHLITGWVSNE